MSDADAEREVVQRLGELIRRSKEYVAAGDLAGAEGALEKAAVLAKKAGYTEDASAVLDRLGSIRAERGDPEGAYTTHARGFSASVAADLRVWAARHLAGMGSSARALGRPEEALIRFAGALVIAPMENPYDYGFARSTAAEVAEIVSSDPAIAGALESSGASMYRKLRRLPRRPELAKSFTDAVSEALADLVAHAGMAGDVDGVGLVRNALEVWTGSQPETSATRRAMAKGLRNAITARTRGGDLTRAERDLEALAGIATGVPDEVEVQHQLAAATLSVLHARLKGTPPASGIRPLIDRLRALSRRFPDDARFADLRDRALRQIGLEELSDRSPYALATGALVQYQLTDDPEALERAVYLLDWARTDDSVPPEERFHATYQLGQVLVGRYRRKGSLDDLQRGIWFVDEVVQATPRDDPERSNRLEFLANGLISAVERMAGELDTETARSHLRIILSSLEEALELTPSDDPARAWRLSSLALGLRLRSESSGSVADLVEAERLLEEALDRANPEDPRQRAGILGNLGAVLNRRYEITGEREHLERAVAALRKAVEICPPSADLIAHRQNLARALAVADSPEEVVNEAFAVAEGVPEDHGWTALEFELTKGERAEKGDRWPEAAEAYARAEEQLDRLVRVQATREFKTRQIRDGAEIAARLAYARVMCGDPDAALGAVERGRARLLSDALRVALADPERVRAAGYPELAEALREGLSGVRQLEAASLDPDSGAAILGGPRGKQVQQELDRVITRIRSIPGLERLMAPPDPMEIRGMPREAPLVYLLAVPAGGLALILHTDAAREPEALPLPGLAAAEVARRAAGFYQAYRRRGDDRGGWLRAIDECCAWSWTAAIGPLTEHLIRSRVDRLTLVPCGWLGLLPLHAAWTADPRHPTGRRYADEGVEISYAPNALAAHLAAERAADRSLDTSVLVVDNPDSLADEGRLVGTGLEAAEIRRLCRGVRVLSSAAAAKPTVLEAMRESSLAHLACHGESLPGIPLKSALLLSGGERLEVHELMNTPLERTRLVVLSACETGAIGQYTPDEAVGLPAALLQAGAGGVIASLWAVPDRATAILMRSFYRGLIEERLPPGEALRRAQQWLRGVRNGELVDAGDLDPPRLPAGAAARLWAANRPFAHPYYWAAFTLTGA